MFVSFAAQPTNNFRLLLVLLQKQNSYNIWFVRYTKSFTVHYYRFVVVVFINTKQNNDSKLFRQK